jgi:adenylylsulfate kinase
MKHFKETLSRSIVKSVAYRILIIALDFATIFWFTGKTNLAVGFVLVSNLYTTVAYFFHERIWDRIAWGKVA